MPDLEIDKSLISSIEILLYTRYEKQTFEGKSIEIRELPPWSDHENELGVSVLIDLQDRCLYKFILEEHVLENLKADLILWRGFNDNYTVYKCPYVMKTAYFAAYNKDNITLIGNIREYTLEECVAMEFIPSSFKSRIEMTLIKDTSLSRFKSILSEDQC